MLNFNSDGASESASDDNEGGRGGSAHWLAVGLLVLLLLVVGAWWVNSEANERVTLSGGTSVLSFPDTGTPAAPVGQPINTNSRTPNGENHDCNPGYALVHDVHDPALRKRYQADLEAASAALQSRLASQPSEQAKAVGLLLRMIPIRTEDAAEFYLQWNPCDADYVPEFKGMSAAQCADRKRLAKERALGFYERSMAEPMLKLAALATQTKDPAVYAQALAACNVGRLYSVPVDAACSQLSLTRWAQLDPDNMEPWLQLAGQAAQQKNELAWLDAAMRAAQVSRRSTYRETPAQRVSALVTANSSDAELFAATEGVASLQVQAIQQWRDPWAWIQPCSKAKVADANRRQTCEALAHNVLKNAASLNDNLEALMLGKYLGWPQEKVQSISREHSILQHLALQSFGQWNFETGQPISESESSQPSCGMQRAQLRRTLRVMTMGEVEMARLRLKESGKTLEQAEGEMLDFRTKLQQQLNTKMASAPAH